MTGKRRNIITVAVPVLLILMPIVYSVGGHVFGQDIDDGTVFLEMPEDPDTRCVRDAEYMRFHHWELLNEIREQFVRDGNREGTRLDDCRRCHANRERFCNRCHAVADVRLDCFGCHYYPETPDTALVGDGGH